jgi:hypothetical protein
LWEEGLDPGLVNEIEGSAKSTKENEVQKDSVVCLAIDVWEEG